MRFELAPFALPANYGENIIPIADAKAHLYVDHDEDDALIGVMRDAAIDMTEKYVQVKLASQAGLIWRSEELRSPLDLGITNVTAINSISYVDDNGDPASMATADARIGLKGQLQPAVGKEWPEDVGGAVEIDFDAGFASADQIPPMLISAAKLFLGHLYANREDVIIGSSAMTIPMGFQALCSMYRRPVI